MLERQLINEQIDLAQAERFIQIIAGSKDASMTFQTFDGKKKDISLTTILHGSFEQVAGKLVNLNRAGAGIFAMIANGDGNGRTEKNVTALRALYLDLDNRGPEHLSELHPEPHLVVRSSTTGLHAYWKIDPIPVDDHNRSEIKAKLHAVLMAICRRFGGDPKVTDALCQVMRLPGFLHNKYEPCPTTIISSSTRPSYTLDELIIEFKVNEPHSSNKTANRKDELDWTVIPAGMEVQELEAFARKKRAQGLIPKEVQYLTLLRNDESCESPIKDDLLLDSIAERACAYDAMFGISGAKFIPKLFVKHIIETWPVISVDGTVYRYDGGVYHPWKAVEIEKEVLNWANNNASPRQLKDVVELLTITTNTPADEVNPPGLLNTRSGVINPETGELRGHSPEMKFTIQLPVSCTNPPSDNNDREPNCPRFQAFLDQVLPEPDRQTAIWEMLAYCLTTDCRLEKGFILYGTGSNGKGVLLGVVRAMLRGLVSELALADLSNKYRPSLLVDKLVNLSSEGESKFYIDDGMVKRIISGEPITAEKKFGDPTEIRPFAKLITATNHLPQTRDTSWGFFRRWLIIHFSETISGRQVDENLTKKIVESELDEIFFGALRALIRLRKQRAFTVPESSETLLEGYVETVNPIPAYISQRICVRKGCSEYLNDIYADYSSWISEEGYKDSLSKPELRKLFEAHTGIHAKRLTGGKYGFKGLCLSSRVQRGEARGKVRKVVELWRECTGTSEGSEIPLN